MAKYLVCVDGKVNNAICQYTIEADSLEEAKAKYIAGDVGDSEILQGDFEADSHNVEDLDFDEEDSQ